MVKIRSALSLSGFAENHYAPLDGFFIEDEGHVIYSHDNTEDLGAYIGEGNAIEVYRKKFFDIAMDIATQYENVTTEEITILLFYPTPELFGKEK